MLYWLFILNSQYGNESLKIALDTDAIMLSKDWHAVCEREKIYGAPFNNEIPSNKDGCANYQLSLAEKIATGSVVTQFYWKHKDSNQFQLEIEEIRDSQRPNCGELYGCKYIHTLFDSNCNEFIHLDGAIREYNLDEIVKREYVALNKCPKSLKYTKLFRVDGIIPFDLWKQIIYTYSPYNSSIVEYFNSHNF